MPQNSFSFALTNAAVSAVGGSKVQLAVSLTAAER